VNGNGQQHQPMVNGNGPAVAIDEEEDHGMLVFDWQSEAGGGLVNGNITDNEEDHGAPLFDYENPVAPDAGGFLVNGNGQQHHPLVNGNGPFMAIDEEDDNGMLVFDWQSEAGDHVAPGAGGGLVNGDVHADNQEDHAPLLFDYENPVAPGAGGGLVNGDVPAVAVNGVLQPNEGFQPGNFAAPGPAGPLVNGNIPTINGVSQLIHELEAEVPAAPGPGSGLVNGNIPTINDIFQLIHELEVENPAAPDAAGGGLVNGNGPAVNGVLPQPN
jgi:hypothetical protein